MVLVESVVIPLNWRRFGGFGGFDFMKHHIRRRVRLPVRIVLGSQLSRLVGQLLRFIDKKRPVEGVAAMIVVARSSKGPLAI